MLPKGKLPPDGWMISGGHLAEAPTVIGYMKRKCEVSGHCHLRDCRRSVFLEWPELVRRGQGHLLVTDVKETLKCARIGRCAMTWTEKPYRTITLGDPAGADHIAVQIRCTGPGCSNAHVTTVATTITRLKAQGAGGPETDALRLAQAIPTPCLKCNGKFWRAEILWHDPAGPEEARWRADLARRRDQARFRSATAPMAPEAPTVTVTPRRMTHGGA